LIRSKQDLPELGKFEIKYEFGGFKEMNNFIHTNFIRLEMYFKLKIWELKVCF
jgi:hypothetical protein